MSDLSTSKSTQPAKLATLDQRSAGGVAFRRRMMETETVGIEVAIISVGDPVRWQLPKGIVDPGETPEETAVREVREEAGIDAALLAPLEPVEYWYVGHRGKQRVRFHKFVHFYVMEYQSGQLSDHDHEVNEARWVDIEQAQKMLAFKGERQAVAQAAAYLAQQV
jgi:8-oxo-dGTP pyrophosphatase MutT (NUDIX family)